MSLTPVITTVFSAAERDLVHGDVVALLDVEGVVKSRHVPGVLVLEEHLLEILEGDDAGARRVERALEPTRNAQLGESSGHSLLLYFMACE